MEEKINDASIEEESRIESLVLAEQPEVEQESEINKDKKIKNLISLVILLAGLFVGSLFVDVVQMVRGGGFSQRALDSTDVFATNGKTWVAYAEPMVTIQVVNDDTCDEACAPDEVLLGLKQTIPTLLTKKVDVNSVEGKQLVSRFNLKTLPAFIFSKEIEKTELFSKAEPFLDKQGDSYAIKSAEAGFPVGKYIAAPAISADDIKIGSDDAKVKVIEYTDFQCPYCKQLHQTVITQLLKDYGDKIQLVFKNYPLPIHPLATSAALAGECANAQGKFAPYADKLFATQDIWSKFKDAAATFKGYAAQLGLNVADFNKCLDSKQFQSQIDATTAEAQSFGIQGTPAIFIGDNFQDGLVKYDDVKKIVDEQLVQ